MSIEQWSDLMFPKQEGTVVPVYGRVKEINADGSYEVQLNSSSITARCAPCCTALVGDRVLVLIKANGKCDAIGRLGGDLVSYLDKKLVIDDGSGKGSTYDVAAEIASLKAAWDSVSRVGSIYMSVDPTDPSELFGGTWKRIEGKFLLGASDSYEVETTGGEAEHVLTVSEMPSHRHGLKMDSGEGSSYGIPVSTRATGGSFDGYMYDVGGSQPHNNMPPYLAVYIWVRTS